MPSQPRSLPPVDPARVRDIPEESVILSLIKAYNHVQTEQLKLFKRFELTPQQYNVLRILYVRGEQGLCNTDIASLMVTRVPDMTRLIDRMARDGLLERRRSEFDRRMVKIHLLPRGRERCQRIDAPLVKMTQDLMKHYSREEQSQLKRLLDKLLEV